MQKKHIVIVGGGFGGIYTYKSLRKSFGNQCDITIIDKQNHFLFTPLLPEVATGGLDHHNVVEPIREIIDHRTRFIQGVVSRVQPQDQQIVLENNDTLQYDALVLALGSQTFFFGTPGAQEHSYILKTLKDAVSIRNRYIDMFERASRESDPEKRRELLRFVIVGGGPTGVELAGEAADLFFKTLDQQYAEIIAEDVSLVLVNAGPALVGMFSEKLQQYAQSGLVRSGVVVMNNARVSVIDKDGVELADGSRIDAPTVVWAAGVSANSIDCTDGTFTLEQGKICVLETMQVDQYPEIFVIGDMSHIAVNDGRGYPMTAQVAKQQGDQTGVNIFNFFNNKELNSFVYHEKGLLASLGRFDAIAQIGKVGFTGIVAWFMWRTVYLFNFASWRKRLRIVFDWTIGLFTRRDTTRLQ